MALIDKVPGDLKLYIGGYVMQTIVSRYPQPPHGFCGSAAMLANKALQHVHAQTA